jgi:hypothetical protein
MRKWLWITPAVLVAGLIGLHYRTSPPVIAGVDCDVACQVREANDQLLTATVNNVDNNVYRGQNRCLGNTMISHFFEEGLKKTSSWLGETFPSSSASQAATSWIAACLKNS